VRGTIGTLFAATLLTLSIGLQILEATGRWDRTFQDTGDEAVVITVVLCMGVALMVAAVRPRTSLSVIHAPLIPRLATASAFVGPSGGESLANPSPPLRLRI
jgi:hypothetical protein